MSIRRSSRAAAGPRSAAARARAAVRSRSLPAVAILIALALQLISFAAVAGAAVTGGVSAPSGAAGDRHAGERGSGSDRSGSGSSAPSGSGRSPRSHATGGAAVPPPGERRGDDSKRDDSKKDDGKKDDGKKGDGKKDEGRNDGDKGGTDDGRKGDREPTRADDDRPGPGAADIPSNYQDLYHAAAAAADVSWRLVAAVGKNESDHGRSKLPGVRSGVNSAGCCSGPMQICTVKACGDTWSAYKRDGNGDGVASVYDAADAVHAAAALLGDLQEMFGKHPALILAGYNAGPGAVKRHNGVPPYRETQNYVERGLDYMRTLGP